MAMGSTSTSLQPVLSGYEVVCKEEDDPFSFSNNLTSLEFDGKGLTPLDWNNYLPFEQELSCWELADPPNTNFNNIGNTMSMSALSVDPLWSMLECQNNCPIPNFIQAQGIGDIPAICSTGPLDEMGSIEQTCPYSSAENCLDDVEAAVVVSCNVQPLAKRSWRECRGDVGSQTNRALSKKEISQYFYMPITQAAKEMNVGLTLLKKRCREIGIRRWPHRKLMSLQTLIRNVQEMRGERSCGGKTNVVVDILEQERRLLEEVPDVQLEEKTKRLRQACFKANYKKRKLSRSSGPYSGASCSSPSCDSVFDYDSAFGYNADGVGGMGW